MKTQGDIYTEGRVIREGIKVTGKDKDKTVITTPSGERQNCILPQLAPPLLQQSSNYWLKKIWF